MIAWIKAIGFTALGIILILIDEKYAKRASEETQTYYTNSAREAYLKDGVRRELMSFWGFFTVIGIILILLGVSEIINAVFGIEVFGFIKGFVKQFF